ncbi:MAG: hypothetical protein AAFN38_25635 [Cyanobacteria bacterium J06560_5]
MMATSLSQKIKRRITHTKYRLTNTLNRYVDEQLPLLEFQFSKESSKWKNLKNKYLGQRCFIIGNGPSLKSQELAVLKNEVTFVSNWFALHKDYESIGPTYHCICAHEIFGGWIDDIKFDPKLYALLREKSKNTTKVFPFFFKSGLDEQEIFPREELSYVSYGPSVQEIHRLKSMNLDIASQRLLHGHTIITSFCLPIAFYLGFKDIYLLGCDCDYGIQQPGDDRDYFYDTTQHTSKAPDFEWLQKSWAEGGPMIQAYAIARQTFESQGRSIFNATAGGKLEVFERANFEALF